jgi:threonine dehydrogenase-like Zn-dependent dehydrogenase
VIAKLTDGRGADICIEATGAPAALQSAIKVAGQEGTIAVLSFFGARKVPLVLSPEFHYGRLRIVSSQVSLLGSGLQPRWSRERRNAVAFDLLRQDWLVTPVSHELPFNRAPEAYSILDATPEEAMGVVLKY